MAFKTFQNGFPLPASDLNNFLMRQSVITFANAAARTAAITSPSEGMLTYLEDTNAYESWDGTAYVALVEAPDLTALIPKSTVTTAGDLIKGTGSSTVDRIGIGTADQVLTVVAGAPAWAAPASQGEGLTLLSTTTLGGASTTISGINQNFKYYEFNIIGWTHSGGSPGVIKPNNETLDSVRMNTLSTTLVNYTNGTMTLGSGSGLPTSAQHEWWGRVNSNRQQFSRKIITLTGGKGEFVMGAAQNYTALNSLVFTTVAGTGTMAGTVLLYGVKYDPNN